jgi:hypothetical protein
MNVSQKILELLSLRDSNYCNFGDMEIAKASNPSFSHSFEEIYYQGNRVYDRSNGQVKRDIPGRWEQELDQLLYSAIANKILGKCVK